SAAHSRSVAAAVAASRARGILPCRLIDPRCNSLPYPLGNVIGGGKHAGEKSPSIQEVLVAPLGATSMREAIQLNFDVHSRVGRELSSMLPYPVGRGDEGGWCPGLTDEDAIQLASEAAREVADRSGRKIRVGVDFAAGSLYNPKDGRYRYRASGKSVDREGQLSYVAELCDRFDLFYVEDPLQEEDFDGFADLTSSLGKTLVVGDDLYTTNLERLQEGARRRSTSGVIIKLNQVGRNGEEKESGSAEKIVVAQLSEKALLATGIRIGTPVRTKTMESFTTRPRPDGLHMIDYSKTLQRIDIAGKFIAFTGPQNTVVYTSKDYGANAVEKFCELTGAIPQVGRFMPGTFTNPLYPGHIDAELVLVADPLSDAQAVVEAGKLGIPVIAVCDTDN